MSHTARRMIDRSSKLTLQEIIESLVIHDSSLSALADDMKQHALNHATWAAYTREVRMNLLTAENELEQVTGKLVTEFARGAGTATAVQNYAKHEVVLSPDVQIAKRRVAEFKNNLAFCVEVFSIFSRRCDLLIALSKLDQNVILSASGPRADAMQVREQITRYNKLEEIMQRPWGAGTL